MALLRGERARGRTLVLSIHQLTDAEEICDRLLLLSAGQCSGPAPGGAPRTGRLSGGGPAGGVPCPYLMGRRAGEHRPANGCRTAARRGALGAGCGRAAWAPAPVRRHAASSARRAAASILLRHEIRELLAGRALWAAAAAVRAAGGVQLRPGSRAVRLRQPGRAAVGRTGAWPLALDGIVVPTSVRSTWPIAFLLPFVAIRAIGHDKQNGTLKLLIQLPVDPGPIVA